MQPNIPKELLTGLTFVEVRHDPWCKTLRTKRADDCICKPQIVMHKDENQFVRNMGGKK